MTDHRDLTNFKSELAALTTLREELKLKAHLARADLKTQYDDLERQWALANEQFQRTKGHLKQDGALVERKVMHLLSDLKTGYQNVKQAFEAH